MFEHYFLCWWSTAAAAAAATAAAAAAAVSDHSRVRGRGRPSVVRQSHSDGREGWRAAGADQNCGGDAPGFWSCGESRVPVVSAESGGTGGTGQHVEETCSGRALGGW